MKAVNLGLSVMWGDCNIGAKECYEEGNLYSWKEIVPEVDRLSALRAPVAMPDSMKNDLAGKLYGTGWKVPTRDQMLELMQNCEFEFVPVGMTKLLKATGPNGNSIYLPLAGNEDRNGNKVQGGFYWTSTKAVEEQNYAYQMRIAEQIHFGYNNINVLQSVRPIYCKKIDKTKRNFNNVETPIHHTKVDRHYIIGQISKLCNELNITYSLTEISSANRKISQKIPMIDYAQTLKLPPLNALGHGDITLVYMKGQKLIGMLIEKATDEYIKNIENCGMVYGIILGIGSITYGADLRTDTIVELKPDEIYVRLY